MHSSLEFAPPPLGQPPSCPSLSKSTLNDFVQYELELHAEVVVTNFACEHKLLQLAFALSKSSPTDCCPPWKILVKNVLPPPIVNAIINIRTIAAIAARTINSSGKPCPRLAIN